MQINQIKEKKVYSQEGNGGSKIANRDKSQNGHWSRLTFRCWQDWPSHCFSDQNLQWASHVHQLIIYGGKKDLGASAFSLSYFLLYCTVLSFLIIYQSRVAEPLLQLVLKVFKGILLFAKA